jgi:cysteinyl-tRNA synthetase
VREVEIQDTLSGERRALSPGEEVGIYACGPTVYSRIHIGNARPFVVFTLLARFLRREGHAVRLVINVTDINDKIYDAAREAGLPSDRFAAQMSRAYVEDTDRLELGRPDAEPLASETIAEIVGMISDLVDSGHAYESGGDVYFRVRSFDGYGKLSNRRFEDMDQGEEAGTESLKEDPLDFALWKSRKEDEDTSWKSPWGRGRPGWHIECSAMAEAELGPEFAIHGGGLDLVFPHHENEIAQSEAAGRAFARIWMHNGMIEIDTEKMSKSEGNIFQLSEALDRFGRDAVIAYLISGHYRQPLAFGTEALGEAAARIDRLRNFLLEQPAAGAPGEEAAAFRERFFDALADDFNTPRAMAEAFELVGEANRRELAGAGTALAEMLDVVGLGSLAGVAEEADAEAKGLLSERQRARQEGDFERADRIRDELAARGWEVRDAPEGARLVRRS